MPLVFKLQRYIHRKLGFVELMEAVLGYVCLASREWIKKIRFMNEFPSEIAKAPGSFF